MTDGAVIAASPVKLVKSNKVIVSELADGRAVLTIHTNKGRVDYLAGELVMSRKRKYVPPIPHP